jgi:hypothetical protein
MDDLSKVVESAVASKVDCCDKPQVMARWSYRHDGTQGSAHCKNCEAGWRYCQEEKKLVRYPTVPPKLEREIDIDARAYLKLRLNAGRLTAAEIDQVFDQLESRFKKPEVNWVPLTEEEKAENRRVNEERGWMDDRASLDNWGST